MKSLEILHIQVCWVLPIAMHYIRTLCDKYFLSYDGFSYFLTGRFRHSVLKCAVGVEWDPKEHCCICPIPL